MTPRSNGMWTAACRAISRPVAGALIAAAAVAWLVPNRVEGADPPPVSSEQSERAQLFIALLKRR
ncbi:MAG: hypothetical protein HY600_03300, partial [Candidatus Omnitrophica bacterium]|nr:hypothetical protein [Candidatus Omnitrophota bacterium]